MIHNKICCDDDDTLPQGTVQPKLSVTNFLITTGVLFTNLQLKRRKEPLPRDYMLTGAHPSSLIPNTTLTPC